MGIVESIKEKFFPNPDKEIKDFAEEFLKEGKPGERIVDFYGNTARFREILEELPDCRFLESSFVVVKSPKGDGLIIIKEGEFVSDGK